MALISMGDWIDRHGDVDRLAQAGASDGALADSAVFIVVPVRRRRAVEPVHARLRSHARRGALRRAVLRRLSASARYR